MRGSILAFTAAVIAASVYVVSVPAATDDELVPDQYLQEAQRQVDVFISWLRHDDLTPHEEMMPEDLAV